MENNEKRESYVAISISKLHRQLTVSAALATFALHPIDTVKVRMQLGQGSGLQVINSMFKNEGIRGFYKGLSAGLFRQAAFTYIGIESYLIMVARRLQANDEKFLSSYQGASCLITAGAIGAFLCNPADLALTRMQANSSLPAALRRNYANLPHALYRIVADEGIFTLWRGAVPTVARTMASCLGYVAVVPVRNSIVRIIGVDRAPKKLEYVIFGLLPPVLSKPFDYVKTQLQRMQPDANGKYPYTGSIDCALKTLRSGGPLKFYTGFSGYCLIFLPHFLLTVACFKQIRRHQISIKYSSS